MATEKALALRKELISYGKLVEEKVSLEAQIKELEMALKMEHAELYGKLDIYKRSVKAAEEVVRLDVQKLYLEEGDEGLEGVEFATASMTEAIDFEDDKMAIAAYLLETGHEECIELKVAPTTNALKSLARRETDEGTCLVNKDGGEIVTVLCSKVSTTIHSKALSTFVRFGEKWENKEGSDGEGN